MLESLVNKVINADCFEILPSIPDKSIDLILCDLPYSKSANAWDKLLDLELLWKEYKRIIKDNRAILLTASSPFNYKLYSYAPELYKYEWIWVKDQGSNFVNAKLMPLQKHEQVLVFSKGTIANGSKRNMLYNPQGLLPISKKKYSKNKFGKLIGSRLSHVDEYIAEWTNYPNSILSYIRDRGLHPSQKPLAMIEYLISTYTVEGDVVLDNCAGSFTVAVASENLKRNWICIEKESNYCEIGKKRIEENRRLKGIVEEVLFDKPNVKETFIDEQLYLF